MNSIPKIWPFLTALAGVFLFFAGQAFRSGQMTGLAFVLLIPILASMHNRHWEPQKYRGQLLGYVVAQAGLVITTLGYWQLTLRPEDAELAERLFLTWISPGQFILLPTGLILFGIYIQQATQLPDWGKPVTLVVGMVGFVGIIPTILNAFGNDTFLILAQLSGIVVLLGWILIGMVLWREAVRLIEV
jgi:hypothetical protein